MLEFLQGDSLFKIFKTHYLNLFDNTELIELSDLATGIIEECNKIGALQLANNFEDFLIKNLLLVKSY